MEFGVVLQTNPPASRVVETMQRAEDAGFTYGWTWDSHVLWQEPFVIYSQVLAATSGLTVGPMVTNPGTRDWSVIASLFATLNDMYGNRTVCGIGRGDSARRVIGQPPMSLATLSSAMTVIKGLAEGREVDAPRPAAADPVGAGRQAGDLDGRVRAQGAQAGRRAGRRVHPADRGPGHRAVDDRRGAFGRGGRGAGSRAR